jgi:hydroxylaminobenzene mutase
MCRSVSVIIATRSKSLVAAGAVLFLLGLLEGAFVQSFPNPRMALSAHLTAVQSGMASMLVGVVWPNVLLNRTLDAVSRWGIALGMAVLWLGLTLSAASGASAILPIAGAGHQAPPAVEQMVSAIVMVSSLAMTVGWALFVFGLLRRRRSGP